MSPTPEAQIEQLKATIAAMEAQRPALGDEVVDASLAPLQSKLSELVAMLQVRGTDPSELPTKQRKLVTLLFMDVVGSTSKIAAHLDPEDTMEIMDDTLKRLAVPVEGHGGHVTRFMGDGFKAIFGAPKAREDDPEQAVRAGLDILGAARTIAEELADQWDIQGFEVRVGVNTGLVALGGMTEAEDTVMGKAVNLAARLESAAPPGGVLISHDTYRHVRGVFDVEPQESITLKGFDESVPVYRVLRAKPRSFRLYTRGVEGVETRMIGREAELKHLQDALLTAIEESEGQMFTISGEAGVGKSRLLYEFQNWIELLPPPAVRFFEGRAHQEAQGVPYGLLRDLFEFRFQIQDDDSAVSARGKIEQGFGDVFGTGKDGMMRAHILGQLLGFDFSASLHLKGVINDAEQLRNRGLMYVSEYIGGLSDQGPVVIFLEDVHWADESSLDAINYIGHRTPQLRLLVVCAARPTLFERHPFWGEGLAFHRLLELKPLSRRESRQLVGEILKQAEEIPAELRELVVDGAEGNPFYVEELIKMLVEDEVIVKGEERWRVQPERLVEIEVPPTLAGVLQARLDSLPAAERQILQQASVVGRLFWDRIVAFIQAGGDGNPEIVPEMLGALRDRELIYRREESAIVDANEYIFKHDVLREVTYESVIKRLRRVYHGLVADWLIKHSTERIGEYSGLIAQHLLLAGKNDQALQFFIQAGEAALASYANAEAEGYFRQALELSPSQPERAALLSGLGETLGRQFRSEEAVETYRQGIDLYRTLGNSDCIADLYARSSKVMWYGGDHSGSWSLCKEGLAQLEGASDGPGLAHLLAEAGRAAYFSGISGEVIPLCQRAIELSERLGDMGMMAEARMTLAFQFEDREKTVSIMEDVAVLAEANGLVSSASRARINLGAYLYQGGKLDLAHKNFLKAVELDRSMGDTSRISFALGDACSSACWLGELQEAEEMLSEIEHIQSFSPDPYLPYHRAHFLFSRGEWVPALELSRAHLTKARRVGDLQLQSYLAHLYAWLSLELNRFEGYDQWIEVEAALEVAIDIALAATKYLHPRYLLAVVRTRQGRLTEARHLYEQERRLFGESESSLDKMYRYWPEYELAFAEEHWGEAVASSKSLIEMCERTGHRWWLARGLIDLVDALIHRQESSDLERARKAVHRSMDMFTEMGAPGYVKVLEERLGTFPSACGV
jgi:class 3 adenylate cyclase/tetratricopeptide (TPR) repeat protein